MPRNSNEGLASQKLKMLWVMTISWFIQGSLCRNPDWLPLKWLIFFNNFRANGEERHWSIVAYCLFRVFFCTGIMLPFFESSRKTPFWRQFLYSNDRDFIIIKLHSSNIRIEIPSWPQALCGFHASVNFEFSPHSRSKPFCLFRV